MTPRNVRLFTWFNFFTDFRLYAPIAILYFQQLTGSFAAGMSIFSVTMITAAFFELPTGVISDLVGRKKTVIAGAAFSVGSVLCYALASGQTLQVSTAIGIVVLGAFLEGVARSFYSGNNNAMIHDSLTEAGQESRFDEHLGTAESMFQVALAVSAVLGSLVGAFSFPLVLWLSVPPQIACLLIAFAMKDPRVFEQEKPHLHTHLKEAVKGFFHSRKLRLLSISSIWGQSFGEVAYQFQSAFYASLWPIWAIGFAKVLGNGGAAAGMHWGKVFIRKFGLERSMFGASIIQRCLVIAATAVPTVATPVIIGASSFPMGISWTAEGVLFQKEFKPHQRATMSSLVSFAGSILFGIVAYVMGSIGDHFSPFTAYFILQLLQIMGIWWRWKILHP